MWSHISTSSVLQSFPPSEHLPSLSGNSADSGTLDFSYSYFTLLHLILISVVVRGFNRLFQTKYVVNRQLATTIHNILFKPDHSNLTMATGFFVGYRDTFLSVE